ncbi:MAG: DUF899 family protein [Pseudomonadota bacterium]
MSANQCSSCHDVSPQTEAESGGEVSANRSPEDAQIDALECRIGELQTELASLRAKRAAQPVGEYSFHDWQQGGTTTLEALFAARSDLILVHNMGVACDYCTLWADGFIGLLPHLENRAAFAVVSPDRPEQQQAIATLRGWPFRMVSAWQSSFTDDMGFIDRDGDPMPGVSSFHKRPDGRIERIQRAEFGPGDVFNAAWHFFDLLAGGVDGWEPKNSY